MTGSGPDEQSIGAISDWLVTCALADTAIDDLFAGYCERLLAAGLPLRRGHLGIQTLHPLITSFTITWSKDDGLEFEHQTHGTDPDWLQSPLYAMLQEREIEVRHRLEAAGDWSRFPRLRSWAQEGATDYVAILTPFGERDRAFERLDGVLCSWLTDRPGGFYVSDLAALRRLQPRLGIAAKVVKREQTADAVAAAYLGADAGRKVLDGRIQRGDGERIQAALWYSDMRGSTALAEALSPEAFIALLDRYFECTAGAVLEQGGQVLSFIGDAVFGVFPLESFGDLGAAADAALAAAVKAEALTRAANGERAGRGEPPIRYGLGLHLGEVLYGNIGVPERLEFSVIGPAANLVARIEGLTKTLDRPLLASAAFAARAAAADWQSCGRHVLRGLAAETEVFALAPVATEAEPM